MDETLEVPTLESQVRKLIEGGAEVKIAMANDIVRMTASLPAQRWACERAMHRKEIELANVSLLTEAATELLVKVQEQLPKAA